MGEAARASSERCKQCGRALLIPLLQDVSAGQGRADAPTLVRCAYCRARAIVHTRDPLAARRAAALTFVTRGGLLPRRDRLG